MQNKKRLIKNKRKILIFARHKMDIEANDINDFSDRSFNVAIVRCKHLCKRR